MFCQQCQQTSTPTGCHQYGQCGKTPEVDVVALTQDLAQLGLNKSDIILTVTVEFSSKIMTQAISKPIIQEKIKPELLLNYRLNIIIFLTTVGEWNR